MDIYNGNKYFMEITKIFEYYIYFGGFKLFLTLVLGRSLSRANFYIFNISYNISCTDFLLILLIFELLRIHIAASVKLC